MASLSSVLTSFLPPQVTIQENEEETEIYSRSCLLISAAAAAASTLSTSTSSLTLRVGLTKYTVLQKFDKVLYVTAKKWTEIPPGADLKLLSILGNVKFVYPESYDQMVQYLAAVGARRKFDLPDLIVVDKLEEFVCVDSSNNVDGGGEGASGFSSRTECHRKLTKALALLSNLTHVTSPTSGCSTSVSAFANRQPFGQTCDDDGGGGEGYSGKGTRVIVGFSPPAASQNFDLTETELDKLGLWMSEVWTCQKILAPASKSLKANAVPKLSKENNLIQYSCRCGPFQDQTLEARL